MKKILLRFYDSRNLGDDLFVKIMADQFPDCLIRIIKKPNSQIKKRNKNIRFHPFWIVRSVAGIFQGKLGWNHPFSHKIERRIQNHIQKIIAAHDAFVFIGGSIFMQHGAAKDEFDFQTNLKPVFDFTSQPQSTGKSFVIGANLGPIFTKDYAEKMKHTFMEYTHVCLRDYSSYCLVDDLPHVQYAPDVIFLAPQPRATTDIENVVVSVIDISNHTKSTTVIESYFALLRDTIAKLQAEKIPITLVSFCKGEGDENAIHHLMNMLPDDTGVSTHFYDGNIERVLALFSNASFVIASRFHSMILGISFGKPVFPISYNCKTQNYLNDMGFNGRYATFSTLVDTTCEDVLYNYKNRIITDCTLHQKYAKNQFRALRTFLDSQ